MQAVLIVRWTLLVGLLLTGTLVHSGFLPPEEAFRHHLERGSDDSLVLRWDIADDYYLYRDAFEFRAGSETITPQFMAEGLIVEDEYFGKSEVYFESVSITIMPGEAQELSFTWQGCAQAGLCYPPQQASFQISELSSGLGSEIAKEGVALPVNESASALAEDQRFASRLAGGGLAVSVAAFFGLGLLLAFTPCVLPMLPVVSALVVGRDVRGCRGMWLALAYRVPQEK